MIKLIFSILLIFSVNNTYAVVPTSVIDTNGETSGDNTESTDSGESTGDNGGINGLDGLGKIVEETGKAIISALGLDKATETMQTTQNVELLKHTDELLKQTKAIAGTRDIMSLPDEMKKFHDVLNTYSLDFMDLTDDIINNPKSQIGAYAKQIFNKYQLFDNCNYNHMTTDMKRICKSRMVRQVQEIATYQKLNETLKKFGKNIKSLAQKRISSKNIKESADIQNAIQIEVAQMTIIKTQLDMMESQNRAKERVDELQFEQIQAEKRKNRDAFIHQDFMKK